MDTYNLRGKCAVVTGSTQGLGEAVARLFVERGAAGVVLCGRNRERGEALAAAIGGDCKVLFAPADLAHIGDCREVMRCADDAFGRVDMLVNCAACTERGNILNTSPELFDRIFAVNTRAPFFLMQDAAKIMRREKIAGAMVNILSMSSYAGQPFITAYSASKSALAGLTRNVAYALLPDRIRVNGLNIGWMNTPAEHAIQTTFHNAPPDWLAAAAAAQPFGRLLEPREVARMVAFLCSDEAGMMTGSVVDFDQSVAGAYDAPPQPAARLAEQS